MIITCVICNKKFNVNNELIPDEGRQIQCGSCNHSWFYEPKNLSLKTYIPKDINKEQEPVLIKDKKNEEDIKIINDDIIIEPVKDKIITNKKKISKKSEPQDKIKNNGLSSFFTYLVVFMITLVAIIVMIDTFKSPLINMFPKLEIIIFDLFETLKDLRLFIIDLT